MKKERNKSEIYKKWQAGREWQRVQEGRRLAQTLNIDAAPLLLVVDLA